MDLVERWDPNCNTFHLPPSEMSIILLYVYRIWGIPIDGWLVQQDKVAYNAMRKKLALWFTMQLMEVFLFASPRSHLRIYISFIIATYMFLDKSISSFSLGLVWVV